MFIPFIYKKQNKGRPSAVSEIGDPSAKQSQILREKKSVIFSHMWDIGLFFK